MNGPAQEHPRTGDPAARRWTPLLVGAGLAVLAMTIASAQVLRAPTDPDLADWLEALSRIAASVAAGLTALLLGLHMSGKLRTAWLLIAASAFVSGLAEAIQLAAELGALPARPIIPFDDLAYVAGQVLVIAGVLSFPSSPLRASSRGRAALDGAAIASSLLYVSWACGVGTLRPSLSIPAQLAGLAIVVTDIVLSTILTLIILRAPRSKSGRLLLLLAGLAIKMVADGELVINTTPFGGGILSPFDLAWILGYLLMALAPLWPARPAQARSEDGPAGLWRMFLPWTGLVLVLAVSLVNVLLDRPEPDYIIYPAAGLVVVLMASQLLSYRDSLGFLRQVRSAHAAQQMQTKLLNQVLEHAPLGVARTSASGRFIAANPRLCELLHASERYLIGAPITEFVGGTTVALNDLYAPLLEGRVDTIELDQEVRRADGSPAWLHWSTTAVRKPDGSLDYYLSMVEDVTVRHDERENMLASLAGLEHLSHLKSEFVSMVSHEFRTALVGIQGFSELMSTEDLDGSEMKELATDIHKDAMRLNRMINEMLDLDRMEAGKIRLRVAPLSMNALLLESVEHARAAAVHHRLTTDLDVALPVIKGDSDRLVQVVSNLLSNAVKYSPEGSEIKVTSRQDADHVHVSVQDHGEGIPKEFQARLFGRYERFESNRASKVVGTGLGLAIARQIVELHGGTIWVESELGSGSTFHFTIPLSGGTALDVQAA